MIEEIEPLGVTVSYTYDASGNQQTVTDALGHTTTTLYDALDRATTMISAVAGPRRSPMTRPGARPA